MSNLVRIEISAIVGLALLFASCANPATTVAHSRAACCASRQNIRYDYTPLPTKPGARAECVTVLLPQAEIPNPLIFRIKNAHILLSRETCEQWVLTHRNVISKRQLDEVVVVANAQKVIDLETYTGFEAQRWIPLMILDVLVSGPTAIIDVRDGIRLKEVCVYTFEDYSGCPAAEIMLCGHGGRSLCFQTGEVIFERDEWVS